VNLTLRNIIYQEPKNTGKRRASKFMVYKYVMYTVLVI